MFDVSLFPQGASNPEGKNKQVENAFEAVMARKEWCFAHENFFGMELGGIKRD